MATKTFKIGLSNTDKQNMAQDVYERLLALTFPEYDTTEDYSVGDFVVYNDQLYKCIGSTSGAWDSTKWQLATLNDLLTDIESAVAFVNDKANVDGNYPTMTVGVADQLSPYDDESGDDQDEPFSFQATGTGNGTQQDFSTGSIALMKEKQGNTVCVNQQIRNPDFSVNANWSEGGGVSSYTISTSNKLITVVTSGSMAYPQISTSVNLPANHKFLFYAEMKCESTTNISKFALGGTNPGYVSVDASTNWTTFCGIKETTAQVSTFIVYAQQRTAQANDTFYVRKVYVIDLTQWFNGDIPADIIANPSNFYRYYQGSLAYNTGTLVNANGRYIKCIGMNQWDEEWELGGIDGSTGNNVSSSYTIRSKNYIKVIPNAEYQYVAPYYCNIRYYDANKNYLGYAVWTKDTHNIIPSNVCYIRFICPQEYGTTYNNDISINLYYEDEARCLTYETYEVLTNNDTGTETLRSAGSVKDYKTPDGTIHRLATNKIDLSTLTFTLNQNNGLYECGDLSSQIKSIINTEKANITCEKYEVVERTNSSNVNESIAVSPTGYIIVKSSSTPSGNAIFELSEPTTEQGTPYSENLVIDDFGSMDFGGDNGVPQGNLIFYPVDYKAFIDTLYNYTDGTPSNIALKSDLSADKSELQGVDSQLQNAIGGTLRQLLASSQSVDFLNTDFVDLGTLTYVKNGNRFEAYFNLAKYTFNEKPNILSTAFKTDTWVNVYNASGDKLISIIDRDSNAGKIAILDSSYNSADTTTFKNAMKGVLLAYEKGE